LDDDVDILVFGAHADDVELACGGTIIESVRRGRSVGIVDLTHAEMGTRGTAELRWQEALNAAAALGVRFRKRLDLGDGGLRTGRDEELEVIELLRRHRPAIVVAPYPDDRHPDHARAGRLVSDAWFYAGLRKLEGGGEAHRADTVVYFLQNYLQPPSFVVDITASMEAKMEAVRKYRSQFHDPESTEPETWIASPEFLGMIEGRARHFGVMIGAAFGEAFVTRQPPRVDDIVAAYRGREIR
jgi:N-acetylglucosamine malate deacetylase 1